MVKRSGVDMAAVPLRGQALPSPGLKEAPVLELMCSHFVLTLAGALFVPYLLWVSYAAVLNGAVWWLNG